jgi:pimeloyl-ACP methyl ester carboxylesterase
MHVKTVTTDAGDIAYVDEGLGPVALFVHGVFVSSRLWQGVIDGVSDMRRCIAVDLPAHGATKVGPDFDMRLPSMADVLEQVCVALDLGQVDLVGSDTGGAVCQLFATRHPERLRTLTLTNCDTEDNLPPENFKGIVEMAKAGQLGALIEQFGENPELGRSEAGLGGGYEHPEAISDETLAAYLAPVATPEGAAALQRCIAALEADDLVAVGPALRKLDVPTLIVWGTADTFFELKWAHWLRDTIPGARARDVVEIEGAKLFFPDERAADLVPVLRDFWSSISASA